MDAEDSAHHSALSFLDAAERVLAEAQVPLSPEQITARAIELRLMQTAGLTPGQTMKGKLSTDILSKRDRSRFKRSGPNTFALRCWPNVQEYIADRFQKALLDEDIVVFERSVLRQFFPEDGITSLSPERGRDLIANTFAMKRLAAEESYQVIQLVSQFLVIYHGKVATHKRTKRLPEKRLHGVSSLLFGGHLNPDDIAPLFGPFDPEVGPLTITRELSEEVRIHGGKPLLQLVGGIYDPRREVSTQHLGILYTVRVPNDCSIEIGERGFLQQLRFEPVTELSRRIEEFENWSELVYRQLLQTRALIP